MKLLLLFIASIIVNNFILSNFLGICPFIGVSKRLDSAVPMGLAVTFVMTMTAVITWIINHLILIKLNMPYLQYVAFILVIATLVQFVEMFLKKFVPGLYRAFGIYLPLITTNCAILGLALLEALKNYNFMESIVFGVGSGLGYTLSMAIMAGIREQMELSNIPKPFQGPAITLITAGILALAFMGFSGMISL
ncbi:MAG: electron transport complex subunit RsxA [Spirochaetes bacterium]|nr:electron transport complex subunit RsxA [Spirochaetota bacterium]NLJ05983.1 electron transport complex subunit RsxA [Exilispira sp.]MBP8991811.1 electron transport complex subunit RsxA [Spirochaetota bacterium]HOV45799.1 electron transport complex subunit RsxA [Exilispira sp.]HPB47484.1 electron transport complex subunit RsxA [Exilispira sp.]